MDKKLLKSKEDWQEWCKQFGKWSTIDIKIEPISYPCIVVWYEWAERNQNYDNAVQQFIYQTDFL